MYRLRKYLVFILIISCFIFLAGRLFYLQIINRALFKKMAEEQHNNSITIDPTRGTIYDRFMEPLAINLDVPSIFADPRAITEKKKTAILLAELLDIDEGFVEKRLSRDKAFVWIKRKVTPEEAINVKKKNISGIYFTKESKRIYPNNDMASHILGFVGVDNKGLEGLELLYDDKLKGTPGIRSYVRDARLKPVMFYDDNSVNVKDGYSLVLTLDSVVQFIVEDELKKMAVKFNAEQASCVVLDPYTGKILAIACYPSYDPNNFSCADQKNKKNTCISSVFEPGSVFKIVTASAALNERIIRPEDIIYCEKGEYRVGGRILHDYHGYGDLSFSEVISRSSNIGTVKVAKELGEGKLYDYIRRFGFGEKTGVDLPGEVPGICRPPRVWSRSDITTIPIGQGIAVTPLQLVCAAAVIANGGYLVKPYIVEKVITMQGDMVEEYAPVLKRKVIDKRTSDIMKDIMEEVVVSGTGKKARSKHFSFCGKTGTAQKVNPDGGYYDNKYNATFIGFVPKDNPEICMVVTADNPHPSHFGGTVAGPFFKDIAERVLEYLETNSDQDRGTFAIEEEGAA